MCSISPDCTPGNVVNSDQNKASLIVIQHAKDTQNLEHPRTWCSNLSEILAARKPITSVHGTGSCNIFLKYFLAEQVLHGFHACGWDSEHFLSSDFSLFTGQQAPVQTYHKISPKKNKEKCDPKFEVSNSAQNTLFMSCTILCFQ